MYETAPSDKLTVQGLGVALGAAKYSSVCSTLTT